MGSYMEWTAYANFAAVKNHAGDTKFVTTLTKDRKFKDEGLFCEENMKNSISPLSLRHK